MMRHVIGKSLVLGLVAIGVGCSTVRQARQAQEEARASVASAPDRPPVPLNGTLAELVDFALTNRPSVLSARLAVTDARLRMKEIAAAFGIADINLVKPSIGEATRVLLRRVPWKLLVKSLDDEAHLGHLYQLAKEKGVEVVVWPLENYLACGLIKNLADN